VAGTVQASFPRTDGQPDTCGDPPPEYPPEIPPTQNDLSTTINIVNIDGFDTTFNLEYNQTNSNYNFPLSFKLNGSNVTFDLSGITIFGDPYITNDNGGNSSPPPGSDGGKDVDGQDYETTYPDVEYPAIPDIVQPKLTEQVLNYLICELDVIETLEKTVKLPPGYNILWQFLLEVIGAILTELCDLPNEVGLPEIYPVLPGVDRPIIMYYYKEFIEDVKQPSTYVSTLPNPSSAAIAELETVSPPDRTLGKTVLSLKLNDGSRIVAAGNSVGEAEVQYNFLLSRVNSSLVPANDVSLRVITENQRLEEREVKCVQIEYYPDGKSFGRNPSSVRKIDPTA
jgi:hypothetical protein